MHRDEKPSTAYATLFFFDPFLPFGVDALDSSCICPYVRFYLRYLSVFQPARARDGTTTMRTLVLDFVREGPSSANSSSS